jgi:hypothetical protein
MGSHMNPLSRRTLLPKHKLDHKIILKFNMMVNSIKLQLWAILIRRPTLVTSP